MSEGQKGLGASRTASPYNHPINYFGIRVGDGDSSYLNSTQFQKRRMFMKNIKKAVLLVLCALLCISLFGCGEKGDIASIPSVDESINGKTINMATSVDPYLSRSLWEFDYVKEKLGVDIEQRIYSPHNIHNEVAADAAADNAPDIFYVNRNFPFFLAELYCIGK